MLAVVQHKKVCDVMRERGVQSVVESRGPQTSLGEVLLALLVTPTPTEAHLDRGGQVWGHPGWGW